MKYDSVSPVIKNKETKVAVGVNIPGVLSLQDITAFYLRIFILKCDVSRVSLPRSVFLSYKIQIFPQLRVCSLIIRSC